uniref:protein-serine/threonine phosphatase n=1 Tax=viral metagenome TaxID=1070528 RepID=A0A6C0EFZ7_9ZZZZ
MSIFEETVQKNTHNVTITSKINQLSKGQDYIYMDEIEDITGEECKVAVVFDGHGNDKVINFIRSISNGIMNLLLKKSNPIQSVANHINNYLLQSSYESSGSTMCMVKIFSNRIECINCGDSQVAVYKNGSLEFLSKEHNYENEKERERLESLVKFVPSSNIKMIDKDTLISVYSEYIEWDFPNSYTKLACSQALGHRNSTGHAPDHTVIKITENDTFKVVIGSDGLWEMIMKDDIADVNNLYNMDATAIVEQTTNRWLQMWNMRDVLNNKPMVQCKFTPKQCDDIAVYVADIKPIPIEKNET